MNLLPFVIIIILIIGIFAQSQFEQTNSIKKEASAYIAYFMGLRESRNNTETHAYSKANKEKKIKNPPSIDKEKQLKMRPFLRDRMVGWPNGRLNLSSLLKEKNKELECIAIAYFESIYSHTEFFPKDAKAFLKILVQKLRVKNIPLHEIIFEDSKMQECFYKILRGTHTYDIVKKEGYPPFAHFFTFENTIHKPMNFHAANTLFLKVALGKKISDQLIKKEQEIMTNNSLISPFKKDDLKQILKEECAFMINLFSFTTPNTERNPEKHIDEQTNITVRID